MATTVNQSQANGTQYTWGNQALLWSDSLAGLRTWDVSFDTIAYSTSVSETLTFAEQVANSASLFKSESFAFSDAIGNTCGLNPSEVLGIADSLVRSYGLNQSESIVFAELPSNQAGKSISESFAFSESQNSTYGLNPSEALTFAESMNRVNSFIRNFAETLTFAELLGKTYGLNKAEAMAIADSIRRQGDLVISDMMVSSSDMTLDDFKDFLAYGNVPGYEKWKDFIPGDYEYREAMIRIVLQSKNADRGLLTDLQACVDVPDLIDRGSATVTNAVAGITVTYNRTFHIVPEITLAARGGIGGNPVAPEFYGTPTKYSFTVRLRDTVTGAYVTGPFTWAAHGY